MKIACLVLYAVAFALQLVGAIGVIQDVRTSIANMGKFKTDLAAADDRAVEHRKVMDGSGNEFMRRTPAADGDAWVWQVGPAGRLQRDAVVNYVNAQNDVSNRRRWGAVWLLLGGLFVGFVGNIVSVFPL